MFFIIKFLVKNENEKNMIYSIEIIISMGPSKYVNELIIT
jgi:hypothetical protein